MEIDTFIDIDNIKYRIKDIIKEFNNKLIERDEIIPLLILALYSRQNMFLFGEPGVSKTYMMRLLASLTGYRDYNINLAEINSPKEMIGSLSDLNDKNHKNILNCDIALLDELFKAKESGILHSLLNIIREKTITLEGKHLKLPLKMVIGASNEFPSGKELEPFDDRFSIRYEVKRILDENNFINFWEEKYDKDLTFKNIIFNDEITETIKIAPLVKDSKEVLEFIVVLRKKIIEEKLKFSDRAFSDAKKILQVNAILNSRTSLNISDVFLFNHIGWRESVGKVRITNIINETIFGTSNEIEIVLNQIEKHKKTIDDQLKGDISLFLNNETKLFNVSVFENTRDKILELESEYIEIYNLLNQILDKRASNKYIEATIRENTFIKNYKDTAFKAKHLIKIRILKKDTKSHITTLSKWLMSNQNIIDYSNNGKQKNS